MSDVLRVVLDAKGFILCNSLFSFLDSVVVAVLWDVQRNIKMNIFYLTFTCRRHIKTRSFLLSPDSKKNIKQHVSCWHFGSFIFLEIRRTELSMWWRETSRMLQLIICKSKKKREFTSCLLNDDKFAAVQMVNLFMHTAPSLGQRSVKVSKVQAFYIFMYFKIFHFVEYWLEQKALMHKFSFKNASIT